MSTVDPSPWSALLRGTNGLRSLALAGGTALHATSVYIVTTIMPSVVEDIGGLSYYAMNTTLFITASIVSATLAGRLAARFGAKRVYLCALALFSLAAFVCASAPSMPFLLLGRTLEGLAGGVLVSMAYVIIRQVFDESLWSRAMGIISAMWGVSTLLGPAIGGVFAQWSHWRWAFWSLQPIVAVLVFIVWRWLPAAAPDASHQTRAPYVRLALLAASVLMISVASVVDILWMQVVFLSVGLISGALIVQLDRKAETRLLPRGAYTRTPLRAIYLTMGVLGIGSTIEIFIPYFLQDLHGFSPLAAGYLTAVAAGGWSFGSLWSASRGDEHAVNAIRRGPWIMSLALISLSWIMRQQEFIGETWGFALLLVSLLCVGLGIGTAWPHLLTRLLQEAPPEEGGLASSSISTVQMYSMSLGSALAGLLVNRAQWGAATKTEGELAAALLLFVVFAVVVAPGILSARTATAAPPPLSVP